MTLLAKALILLRTLPFSGLAALMCLGIASADGRAAGEFQVAPSAVALEGNYSLAQLVVTIRGSDGTVTDASPDLTHQAVFTSSNPRVVTVDKTGRLLASGNGAAAVTVTVNGRAQLVPVTVAGMVDGPKISYTEQVMPIIAKAGCNAGACHASQYGKGGFKLTVFAYAPQEDYHNIVRDGFGRRVNLVDPERSLFLLKPTSAVPHGGGRRIERGSVDYQILRSWIACGAPPPASAPEISSLAIFPPRRVAAKGHKQQLRVVAHYPNGKSKDVTAFARFDSTDDGVLRVSRSGLIETVGRGQANAMVRFEGHAQIAQVVVPYSDKVDLKGWKDQSFIDRLAAAKFKELAISPSPLCDDAAFLRRAYLDAIGTLPTVDQAKAFLDSSDPEKRKKLIDSLLGLTGDPAKDIYNNQYAAYWTLKWSDLVRSNSVSLGEQGMWAMYNWLKASFRENKPFDRFVRELITATGSTYDNGPSNFFVVFNGSDTRTEATAQIFLGMRVTCAKCHHHPFEHISKADFNEFSTFFQQVGSKGSANYGRLGGPSVILVRADATPRPMPKHILGMPVNGKAYPPRLDRRQALADWLTARDNPFFARNVVNRYVAYLLGRGLVEPIDDMRATNPPSNVELMNALAEDFAKSGFNVKHLLRTIMNSRLYQLSSQPTEANAFDSQFYSHYFVKRVQAESLLDAVNAVTGVPTKFPKLPLGTRAIELPDAQYENYFLKTFGKPKREVVCECERVSDPNLAQALHTLNSERIEDKIASPRGRIAGLLAARKPHEEIVTELYLAALSRRPTSAEQATWKKLLREAPKAQLFYEDLLWSLINSKHFLFVR